MHILKTGGTTLHSIITRNYENDRICNVDACYRKESISHFKNCSIEMIDNYDCLKGHMGFGLHKYFKSKARYITILRDH